MSIINTWNKVQGTFSVKVEPNLTLNNDVEMNALVASGPHPSLNSVQIFILVATLPPCSFPWALEENEPNSIVRRKSSLAQANSNIHCSGHSPKFRPKHVTSAQTMSVNFNILAQNTRPYAFCLLLDVNEETSIPDCCY